MDNRMDNRNRMNMNGIKTKLKLNRGLEMEMEKTNGTDNERTNRTEMECFKYCVYSWN